VLMHAHLRAWLEQAFAPIVNPRTRERVEA
jgi:hypothetical protein